MTQFCISSPYPKNDASFTKQSFLMNSTPLVTCCCTHRQSIFRQFFSPSLSAPGLDSPNASLAKKQHADPMETSVFPTALNLPVL